MKALDPVAVSSAIAELVCRIDEVHGLFLDATLALTDSVKPYVDAQNATGKTLQGTMIYGDPDPNDPSTEAFHQVKFEDLIARNSFGGANHVRLSQVSVVMTYQLWEDEFRTRIAKACGVESNDLKRPVFGDLRRLRNEILHHGGILSGGEAKRLEIVTDLQPNQPIVFTPKQIHRLVVAVKTALDSIELEHTGNDPRHRDVMFPAVLAP